METDEGFPVSYGPMLADVQLLEAPAAVAQQLLERGGTVRLPGLSTDEAVLVTDTATFSVRQYETSNSLLLAVNHGGPLEASAFRPAPVCCCDWLGLTRRPSPSETGFVM